MADGRSFHGMSEAELRGEHRLLSEYLEREGGSAAERAELAGYTLQIKRWDAADQGRMLIHIEIDQSDINEIRGGQSYLTLGRRLITAAAETLRLST